MEETKFQIFTRRIMCNRLLSLTVALVFTVMNSTHGQTLSEPPRFDHTTAPQNGVSAEPMIQSGSAEPVVQQSPVIPDFYLQASRASDLSLDKPEPSTPEVNWDIYNDRQKYPVDPRKPCNDCVRPPSKAPLTQFNTKAFLGRPHMDRGPGGCLCGQRKCKKCNKMTNVYWPRPFSARLESMFPGRANSMNAACQPRKLVDGFDRLENFRLINYVRCDNGEKGEFFGLNKEVYGCLGESKHFGTVPGVGFREPGSPIQRGLPEMTPQKTIAPLPNKTSGARLANPTKLFTPFPSYRNQSRQDVSLYPKAQRR